MSNVELFVNTENKVYFKCEKPDGTVAFMTNKDFAGGKVNMTLIYSIA